MTKRKRSARRILLASLYFLAVSAVSLIVLEVAARKIGLGDPIIYYNAAWGGMRPLPGQKVTRVNGATVTVDSNGFRTNHRRSDNAVRVLYLGDSVTWGGSAIDDSLLFSEISANVLRATGREVYSMNAGVNGTGLANQADIFASLQDSTDVLVWLFPWADTKRSYTTVSFLWPPTQKPRFALVEAVDHIVREQWLGRFRVATEQQSDEYINSSTPDGYEDFFASVIRERERRNISAFHAGIRSAIALEIPIIVGITPVQDDGTMAEHSADAIALIDSVSTLGVHVLDIRKALQDGGTGAERAYIDKLHFSSTGHSLVGRALGAELVRVMGDTGSEAP
ncbi:MAG: hypothetical protein HKN13_05310 [Rhodothermales bacterium]|nr:hypothetical protein [Rhodothermales bacterium]